MTGILINDRASVSVKGVPFVEEGAWSLAMAMGAAKVGQSHLGDVLGADSGA